ncbi:MAG: ABC transporter ATP-binding protein [Planctomycetota bacterium]
MTDLRLERVSKQYDATSWGVRDIDLDVRRGELLAIVGASGSGKTTLLRLIAGLEQPTSGEVHLGERRVTHSPPWERGVGLVAEAAALLPHLTVEENLEWSRRQRRRHGVDAGKGGGTEEDNRHELTAVAIAEMLGLSGTLARRPAELSAGQQQRVALGRALAAQPAILLLDEPLGRIDGPGRLSLAWELKQAQRATGSTWIYVTHDRQEAAAVADRVAVLDEGQLLQVGTECQLRENPCDLRVMSWWWDGWLSGLAGQGIRIAGRDRFSRRFLHPRLPHIDWEMTRWRETGSSGRLDACPVIAVWPAERVTVTASPRPAMTDGVSGVDDDGNGSGKRNEIEGTLNPDDGEFECRVTAAFRDGNLESSSLESSNRESSNRENCGWNHDSRQVARSTGTVIERRDWQGDSWALVALDGQNGGRIASGLRGTGDWNVWFSTLVARGWVWGRIQARYSKPVGKLSANAAKNEATTADTVEIEVGTRVSVEFKAADACWFER